MSIVNENKICFIICSNNEQFLEECIFYLNRLYVPEGMETDILVVYDAESMAAGYNEAMNSSDAKYKVYLHQDTFIVCREFIPKLLEVFRSDEIIGIVGMIGAEKLARDGVMWHGDRCGDFYNLDQLLKNGLKGIDKLEEGIREVQVVDGLLIATQYDLPWREDILKGWDFYDVSQCLEFRRAGYKVVVPAQNPSWTNHRCGAPSYWNYEKNRQIILKEYPEISNAGEGRQILFVRCQQINIIGPAVALTIAGYNVRIWDEDVSHGIYDPEHIENLEERIEESHCELVFTYDFCVCVAEACHNLGIKYLCWIYDSPLFELYRKEALYPNNYIRVFDRKQYERMMALGLPNLSYGPLATDIEMFGYVSVSNEDMAEYQADISFLGRLYNIGRFDVLMKGSEKKYKDEVKHIFESCLCKWDGKTTIYGKASMELVDFLLESEPVTDWDNYRMDKTFYEESFKLGRRLNELERVTILNKLAERHQVVIYTDDENVSKLQGVEVRRALLYSEEMPKAFYVSKINLNITSRSIDSGIPQRVFDIMASGGFVLTNYQPELEEYFEIGKDLEVFHDLDELMEKVDYYLAHEEARIRIAMNGYRKVREKYSYTILATEWVKQVLAEET